MRRLPILVLVALLAVGGWGPAWAQNNTPPTAINQTLLNAVTSNTSGTAMNVFGYLTLTYHITGTMGTASVAFEVSPDNSNWSEIKCSGIDGSTATSEAVNAVGYRCNLGGTVPFARARTFNHRGTSITVYGVASPLGYSTNP